jgi:protoporphyrinogen/coproporphyrinogen III oxidase
VKFAVVGGGIAGLAAAWELVGPRPPEAEVTVFEPAHLGGKLRTTSFLGHQVDEAPDSLITRVPDGVVLCQELGLGDELVAPAAGRALLFSQGKLWPLPGGLVLGAPSRLLPLVQSRILSPAGIARASLDLVLPSSKFGEDASVFSLVASRFGAEVADRLVGPLLGTIHAGDTRQLSAAATAPQLLNAARSSRSLMAGLRRATATRSSTNGAGAARTAAGGAGAGAAGAGAAGTAAGGAGAGAAGAGAAGTAAGGADAGGTGAGGTGAPPATGPLFVAPRGGMQSVADRLVERLANAGARFVPTEVSGLRRSGRSVVVEPTGDVFDGVVVAIPAPAAFSLLEPVLRASAPSPLANMDFSSVAVVTLGFSTDAFEVPADLSGVLVTPGSGLLMTACSFGSNKWPHWAGPGTMVVRVSVGRTGDETWADLADEALVERLCDELGTVLGALRNDRAGSPGLVPIGWRVSRWPRSMPQYQVGHLQRVAAAREEIARQVPMIGVAGSSYGGVGVPSCIGSGRRAGRELKEAVGSFGLPAA